MKPEKESGFTKFNVALMSVRDSFVFWFLRFSFLLRTEAQNLLQQIYISVNVGSSPIILFILMIPRLMKFADFMIVFIRKVFFW